VSYIVGITGGIGSGKSAVTALLGNFGITIVDADLVARIIVQPGTPALAAIASHFDEPVAGEKILLADGTLNRAALRSRVFSNEGERLWLEQLTHPLIGEEILRQLQSSPSPYTVLSSPLLLETHQKELADCIIVVDVSEETQLRRTIQRDNNDEAQVKRIMAAQINRNERVALADIVIDNSKSLDELELAVNQLHQTLLLRAGAQGRKSTKT